MREGARRSAGFTLIEVLAYLAITTSIMGTIVGAEMSAHRLSQHEAAALDFIYQADRLFEAIAEDCDCGTAVGIGEGPELRFVGGSTYLEKDGSILRDSKLFVPGEVHLLVSRDERHPRLLRVAVRFRRTLGAGDADERSYERSFLVRNLEGYGRGGI